MGQYLTTNNNPSDKNINDGSSTISNDNENNRLRELDERCEIIKNNMDREYTSMLRNRASKYNRKS